MEITPSRFEIESRFRAVKLSSLHAPLARALTLKVAGVNIRIAFDTAWTPDVLAMCTAYWAMFADQCGVEPLSEVDIILSPADGEFIDQGHAIWNEPEPFMRRIEDPTGTWLFHRDFTCVVRGNKYHAWLPKPSYEFTDALDNILSVAVHAAAEKRASFLFHCAVAEHCGKAVVFFGPSGVGKSTVAKLCREIGLKAMASDQAYLRIEGNRLWASPSPTRNPEIPREPSAWATQPLEVKTLFALKRTSLFEILKVDDVEFTRRLFTEIFRDETDLEFHAALRFARDVSLLGDLRRASLSYPLGFNFWPRAKEMGYI